MILRVGVQTPLWRLFDYLPLDHLSNDYQVGMRVEISFGKRRVVGMIVDIVSESNISIEKLKHIIALIDKRPIISPSLMKLYRWASDYYHHPLGDVILGTLPKWVREGRPLEIFKKNYYILDLPSDFSFENELKRAKNQKELLQWMQKTQGKVSEDQLKQNGISLATLQAVLKKNWIKKINESVDETKSTFQSSPFELNDDQKKAIETISQSHGFQTFVLAGVTGSGKTEVYLNCIANLKPDQQALVLVPEIALTPQTVRRFGERFSAPIVTFHSKLSDKERMQAWALVNSGEAKIIIGTRSAIFTPLHSPGIIILDEEHDLSFKSQSGFRYSARDLAVIRASMENIPLILGSATPSLETLYNVERNRYVSLSLPMRAGESKLPDIKTIDLRGQLLQGGISEALMSGIEKHLNQNQQILLFLNRRGYAPTLMCRQCGWMVHCKYCDARMTLHLSPKKLICHHCGDEKYPERICTQCQQSELSMVGVGTERLEEILKNRFPEQSILRIDRDSVRSKKSMRTALKKAYQQEANILIGTQMLAKGHHFSNLTLVAIIDADSGFFSSDFRATERMAQLIMQVAGRAGREKQKGEVILQTYHPNHPMITTLIHQGYDAFSKVLLEERKLTKLPPYTHVALIKAEAKQKTKPLEFLEKIKMTAHQFNLANIDIFGPVPAVMERKADYFHAHLLFQTHQRPRLQQLLKDLILQLDNSQWSKNIRWSLDVDPMLL